MINHNIDELLSSSRKILLLQSPIGYFFTDLSQWLKKHNKIVFKLNFNAGDEYFYPETDDHNNPYTYTGKLTEFDNFLRDFIKKNNIDTFICFGDTRPYHVIAKKLAKKLNITFWVLEEGYFRPHFITLEKEGVNAFSTIPRNKEFYLQFSNLPQSAKPQNVASGFLPAAKLAAKYYHQANKNKNKYPFYKHHRMLNTTYYIKHWIKSGLKKINKKLYTYHFIKDVKKNKFGDFYILPLQVYNDSQVKIHSDFDSVADFLIYVLESFAKNAPKNLTLIVKHHPMDIGFTDYNNIIEKYKILYPHLKHKLYYIYDVPLPILLRKGKGMITLNSTCGISALIHNMPVITLGRANYDFEGLTHQGTLKNFWHKPTKPNKQVFRGFQNYHLNKTQINGSFYNKVILP
ncbi:capsule biosynthesis protein [Mergibacter septicus]|uniref:Capsule biosynthesis protein n=1 Tax=Mergibacter septicus TaxID=221402 RepID=A0A8E3MGG7_9PAST|nr:capsule polysaccharide modification protein [Mergibacter septicus]AWX15664.1 capsule biosynthesis protein [Mergibacter septicus]QDJ14918.1 capsule biosynthesis protein [Mergibacter septicus]UTU47656.1 capsule biosynthesis protein [Mergibacter septicus]WMR96739.1 capsule polysaccharide modification protein [Mergibacter septicus]